MAITSNSYTGNGSTTLYSFTFPYLNESDVKVTLNGTPTTAYTFANATTIQFTTAPAAGVTIRIYRETDDNQIEAVFSPGSSIRAADLNENFDQILYISQEGAKRDYVDTLYKNLFYLGSYATDPTTDNSGNPLSTGLTYFNTTSKVMRVWNGTSWQDASANANVLRWRKTAVGGETSLSGADDNAATLTYTVNLEFVYLNGALLQRGVDYTASNGTSITGLTALTAGDVVEVVSYTSFSLVNVPGSTIQDGTISTQKLADGAITSDKIADGTIVNTDVNTNAGIQASKLSFTQAGTGAVSRTVDSKLKDTIHVKDFGAVGDGTTDDTAAIQAAITAAAGKTLVFDAVTYKTTSTLTISSHGTKLYGRGATIDYYGTAHAIGFGLVGGTAYPVEIEIHNLSIIVNSGTSSSGILLRTSYSRYYNVNVLLRVAATSAKGFVLVGDEANGTGPYYNLFFGCTVQSQSSGADHIGVQFSSQSPLYRAGNANTWVGGRIGQCATGFSITGNGNTLLHPTIENASLTGIAVDFVSPAALKCTQNNVVGAYVENANTAFRFGSNTNGNGLFNPYVTGASTFITDSGAENIYLTSNAPSRLPTGAKFGTLSSDASVLDYYEEGTWTPTLVGGTTSGTYAITTTTAKYTRIGRLVNVSFNGSITITSAGSGVARFGGLPFAKGSAMAMTGSVILTNFTLPSGHGGVVIQPWTSNSDSTFALAVNRSAQAPYDITCADINSGASILISFTYFV